MVASPPVGVAGHAHAYNPVYCTVSLAWAGGPGWHTPDDIQTYRFEVVLTPRGRLTIEAYGVDGIEPLDGWPADAGTRYFADALRRQLEDRLLRPVDGITANKIGEGVRQ